MSASPLVIKPLSNLTEYSESLKRMVPMHVRHVSAGNQHSVAILGTESGSDDAYAWGRNDHSQLGLDAHRRGVNVPVKLGVASATGGGGLNLELARHAKAHAGFDSTFILA